MREINWLSSAVVVLVGLFAACGERSERLTVDAMAIPGPGSIEVTWSSAGTFSGFDVQVAAAPEMPMSTGAYGLGPSAQSFTVTGLTPGVTYNVAVFAYMGTTLKATSRTTAVVGAGPAVYVAAVPLAGDSPGSILQYSVRADGTLEALNTPSVGAGGGVSAIAVGPTRSGGRFAYAVNPLDDSVSQYAISFTGELSPLSPATVATGDSPSNIAITSNGSVVLVTNNVGNTISRYSVDGSGRLTELTPAVATGASPSGICIANDANVYVSNAGPTEGIRQYSLSSLGAVTALSPATVGSAGQLSIACDPGGASVYAGASVPPNGVMLQYSRGTLGALAPLTPATVGSSSSMASYVAVDPSGTHAVSLDLLDYTVSLYSINSDGTLVAGSPATVLLGGAPNAAAFDPSGDFLYVVDSTGTISQFRVGDTSLTPLSPATITTTGMTLLGVSAASAPTP